jgi:hypothetical protein
MKILIRVFLLSLGLFGSTAFGQQPTPSPYPRDAPLTGLGPISSSLKDDLVRAEIEPRVKQFKMNIRFLRAKYSVPKFGELSGHEYLWDYFTEAAIEVKFYKAPPGHYPTGSARDRKRKIVNEMEMLLAKKKLKVIAQKDVTVGPEFTRDYEYTVEGGELRQRMFVHNGVWYSLTAQPKTPDANELITKLFDSFTFLDNRK